ncbi:efflux RND transporter periplasmic adaptor subunit [Adhaeribacter rhizoryzae]|uniref:Efflux RND transporter periplasmic adaptor subunit n=1 Tax=Adhaeribacter rhizoryzae TaxID=2607907 RepID=A0A5M6D7R8_9BACT|nr:efflux RND transporter periplasmic adaptor subunit [Adhaeribacter rhizoryzae]KAA5543393.1 efflux RND transporter periplasmic adaptor subunit [Adhaeribacter rhizoryzae]
MKNKIGVFVLSFAIVLSACNKEAASKEEQLAELKKQQTEIQGQIASLEEQLRTEGKLSTPAAAAVPVATLTVTPQAFSNFLEVQGRVDFDQNVVVSAKVPGVLTSVRAKRGDQVSKGQVLATIDAGILEQGVAELRTSLDLARTVYEKQKNLWDQKIGTEIQYLQAKNNKEALERRLATMREQQAQYLIKAPISGVVDEFNPKIGEAVGPGSPVPVARIVNTTGLKVVADIPEAHAGKLRKGVDALVSLPDIGQEFPANVTAVTQVINTSNRSFPIEIRIKGKLDAPIRPNMVAIVKVKEYNNPNALVVPVNIIQRDESDSYVYVVEKEGNGTVVKRRKVTLGQTYAGNTEITSGLNPNDQVVTAGQQNLNEGQAVALNK